MECKLNDWNENTRENIHIAVTPLCNRNCKYCCNNGYDWNTIKPVTEEELKMCRNIYLTGGEPFVYSNPNNIARYYKNHYPNIKKIVVYTNARELLNYLKQNGSLNNIDSVNISIKCHDDLMCFEQIIDNEAVKHTFSNRCLCFEGLTPTHNGNFEIIHREWQTEFKPSSDSVFRKIF